MFKCIEGKTANEVWGQAYEIVKNGDHVNSRIGVNREVLHAALSIEDPIQKWVSCKHPPISIGYALAELIWILHGSDEASVINYWNVALPNYAGAYQHYPGAYGNRIFLQHGINQLEKVYETLKNNLESRQAVILIWDPKTDLPQCDGKPNNNDIPCNICSMIKVRNNKLEWTQIMRSNDLVLGLPYNIVQFTSIQEILASWLEIETGSYNHISDSLHIYEEKTNALKATSINVTNKDTLSIRKEDFYEVIKLIYSTMKLISDNSETNEISLKEMSCQDTGYEAYNNILRIICAYAANKQQQFTDRDYIISTCTNDAYVIMWNNWTKYHSGGNNHVKNN